ncbi:MULTISPECIES: cupin domain-containing protein [unclassified Streptosporangium]|uniref:cupin domain-containing protein n=1 Tax=unclassified Streptosporangium TaxID=2632669 RepID=UPI002E28214F|nr:MULTISPECIES: cupin [unclassified Streptosporangium]
MFGTGVSDLTVYDWPAEDGLRGGSPHLHTLCAEAYAVVAGSGAVQTLTWSGYQETALAPGAVVRFTPGTVHRLVNGGGLRIVVLMQNSGLPEAGDAVLTFPPGVLADPARYAAAARSAPRERRDLAVEGFLRLRAEGRPGFAAFLEAAAGLVAPRLDAFESRWRDGPLRAAETTGAQLAALRAGDLAHLREAAVTRVPSVPRDGMCGHLLTYPADLPDLPGVAEHAEHGRD